MAAQREGLAVGGIRDAPDTQVGPGDVVVASVGQVPEPEPPAQDDSKRLFDQAGKRDALPCVSDDALLALPQIGTR